MNFQRWNIGLDIQPGRITALGLQRRRNGWQLRHWWQHDFPHPGGPLDPVAAPPELLQLLRHWKTLLPAVSSLRIGLPPHLVLRRELPLPRQIMCEPQRGRYVRAATGQLFPEGSGPLALDYQSGTSGAQTIAVTVASQTLLTQWQALFRRAGLSPSVFEVMSAGLAVALNAGKPCGDGVLVHCGSLFWLWAARRQGVLSHGWQFRQQYTDAETLCREHCPDVQRRFYCDDSGQSPPAGFQLFDPLSPVTHRYPPLPANNSSFTLAAGLAFRPEDCL